MLASGMKLRLLLVCTALVSLPGVFLAAETSARSDDSHWFDFVPGDETPAQESAISLRWLNEKFAGEHGYIEAKDGQFVHGNSGKPVRFWAVNGPPHDMEGDALKQCARMLARYGVNMVRVHGAMFDKDGEIDPAKVKHALELVTAMKAEGIYTHFSIYFPLWFRPRADHPWLKGYDGKKHPFATLMFNPAFQEKHREWLKALLMTPGADGKTLVEEPAVFGVEIQNEDSFFFWTFNENNLPEPQLRMIESQFGDWLKNKYGSVEAAFNQWKGQRLKRDAPEQNRIAFRPLWNVFNEKTTRDRDTVRFLYETQTKFYRGTYSFLRKLGFKGLIHASNWSTASPEVLGPLEKLSYTEGDFIDRHGYFECSHKGDSAEWSIRNGHTYQDRSALRFEAGDPTKPRQFVHPVMDPHYDAKPSMISETTFTRPNRYRSEAPLYYAAYGALQDSDAIVHFAFDGMNWKVKPNFWMQQWTVATPAMLGQFPAAALIYRQGLIAVGDVLAEVKLSTNDLFGLKGTPLPQDASLDELRLKDIPQSGEPKPGQRLTPLLHYAGRAQVTFGNQTSTRVAELTALIDPAAQKVVNGTRELELDYGKGALTMNAPRIQAISGALSRLGKVDLKDIQVSSELDLGHIVLVSLDGNPLATSRRMLLQVMSEERATGFETEPAGGKGKRIKNIGRDPWQVKKLSGTIVLKRPDVAQLTVKPLDLNGRPSGQPGEAARIILQPNTLYYLISAKDSR